MHWSKQRTARYQGVRIPLSPHSLVIYFLQTFLSLMLMIKIFITGGTFDKSYDYINGKLFFEKTHLPEMIKRSKCRLDIEIETIVMKDSLDLTTKDVSMIVDSCKNEKSNRIIITHGTDTITNTAKLISNQKLIDKTIILTGL